MLGEYEKLREKELLWLMNDSDIEPYKNCAGIDEVERLYEQIFPAFYEGSVRRWMGWHKGVHMWTDGDSLRS